MDIIFTIVIVISKVLIVYQINGFNGFSSFLMVMLDIKGKRGSEFLRDSGPRPPEALGILMQPPLMLASLEIINHFSMQPK